MTNVNYSVDTKEGTVTYVTGCYGKSGGMFQRMETWHEIVTRSIPTEALQRLRKAEARLDEARRAGAEDKLLFNGYWFRKRALELERSQDAAIAASLESGKELSRIRR